MPKINPIKWSGSKAYCSRLILSKSKDSTHYCEPFLGSGAVFLEALTEPKFESFYISDTCVPLIDLWLAIRDRSPYLCGRYASMWKDLNGKSTDGAKNEYYLSVRDRFNRESDPADFLFLLRTCFNGLVRFNKSGMFNSPFHHTRAGANPAKLSAIIETYSNLMRHVGNVAIRHADYREADVRDTGFTFLDPPYGGGGSKMYTGSFDHGAFVEFAESCPGTVAVTLSATDMPPAFNSIAIKSKGSFKKLIGAESTESVEMLYWK